MGRSDQLAYREADRVAYEKVKAASGIRFERTQAADLTRIGWPTTRHETKDAQLAFGDLRIYVAPNYIDTEVKHDERMHITGNVCIEVCERRKSERMVHSGIYATSSAQWYLVGDYSRVFIFERELLRQQRKDHELKKVHAYNRHTGWCFLLTLDEAVRLATYDIPWRGRAWNGASCSTE